MDGDGIGDLCDDDNDNDGIRDEDVSISVTMLLTYVCIHISLISTFAYNLYHTRRITDSSSAHVLLNTACVVRIINNFTHM